MENEKNYGGTLSGGVRNVAVAALLLLSLFLFAKSVNEFKRSVFIGREIPPQATITVSGRGEVVEKPDITTFSFGVTEESLVISEAQDRAAQTMNDILDFLRENNIEGKDIKTTGYNIYPRYEYTGSAGWYPPSGKRNLVAYVVSQDITVKVRKISEVGKLMGGLSELGANDVSNLAFGFDKEEDLKKEARKEAIKDAQAKAKVLAKDLGVKLVRLVSFSEAGSQLTYARYEAVAAPAVGKGGGAAPEIPSGEEKLVSQVSVTYEIR